MNTPKWAQDLILDAILYLQSLSGQGVKAELPDIKWRKATSRHFDFLSDTDTRKPRTHSSGICHLNHITIVAGKDRVDCKLVILHELSHWVLPLKVGHEGHTPRFWDLAWQLYREFKLPLRYCKQRETEYRKGALAAYHRNRKLTLP